MHDVLRRRQRRPDQSVDVGELLAWHPVKNNPAELRRLGQHRACGSATEGVGRALRQPTDDHLRVEAYLKLLEPELDRPLKRRTHSGAFRLFHGAHAHHANVLGDDATCRGGQHEGRGRPPVAHPAVARGDWPLHRLAATGAGLLRQPAALGILQRCAIGRRAVLRRWGRSATRPIVASRCTRGHE